MLFLCVDLYLAVAPCKALRRDIQLFELTVQRIRHGARHKLRRRLREVYRLHTPELKQGYDIILVARVRTAHASWPEIQKQFLKLCRKLDLLEEAQ